MKTQQLEGKLGLLVDVLRKQPDRELNLIEVAEVTELLISTVRRFMTSLDTNIYREFGHLSERIAATRREVAKLRPNEIKASKLPRAGQELAEIVRATEEATNGIMSSAEEIMALDLSAPDAKDKLDAACMRIFEACSFQDITGQRVTKVVSTLSYIEDRLSGLSSHFDGVLEGEEEAKTGDEALLNGPQLRGEGVAQNDVDALMGGAQPAPAAGGGASQDDIDALMGGGGAAPAPAKPASQDDIDALLAGDAKPAAPAPGKTATQDDIDNLFK
ncbi:MAG: protein phosphatase CheZ [Alphaproteobacteria bacterium]|nr:protein phosphatase CheZ [Alphaproteobacteria bacterium]